MKKGKHVVRDDTEESDEDKTVDELLEDDTVCAICDNGGRVLCCDGECKRCFHATVAHAGTDSNCESLGLSKAELAAPEYLCLNCRYKKHQCFACGVLGSSDCSSAQEVFRCASPSCGHFYHPACVAHLLYPENEVGSKNLQNKIATGGPFTCPVHKCHDCKQNENSMVCELQFAICRRCPRVYHRKCLPREIAYAEELGLPERAWDNLLPRNRILIYCMKHKIPKHLATPSKNHIVFPEVKTKAQSSPSSQQRVLKRKRIISEEFQRSVSAKKTKQVEILTPIEQSKSVGNNVKNNSVQSLDSTKRLSTSSTSEATLKESMKSSVGQSFKQQKMPTNSIGSEPSIDVEMEKRMKMLVNEAAFSLTLNDFKREFKNRVKPAKAKLVNTANSQEKAEGTDRAIRTALEKLEEHSKFGESNDAFDPKILNQITKWKVVDKLHAYVHKGDTVVSVSYGANDFTCSMKQRLEGSGKDCSFENYYVCQSKNVCTVEESGWLSADRLATGSKLIICLNIPFGISSALANTSIDKALDFKPKLLVLFVPKNINMSEKKHRYELIWKDSEDLSSEIFPSSMRISDDKMKIWNSKPPVLYLWSRTDWCPQHTKIARLCCHMPTSQKGSNVEGGKEEEEEESDEEEEEESDEEESDEEEEEESEEEESDEEEEEESDEEEDEKEEEGEEQEGQEEEEEGEEQGGQEEEEEGEEQEQEEEGQEHEQEETNYRIKVVTSVQTNEVRSAFPDNLKSMFSSSHGVPPSSAVPGENQEKKDTKDLEDDFPDNLSSMPSSSHCMAPSSAAPTENQDAYVFDFAPGPYRPYSHDKHSSCGWIDDE